MKIKQIKIFNNILCCVCILNGTSEQRKWKIYEWHRKKACNLCCVIILCMKSFENKSTHKRIIILFLYHKAKYNMEWQQTRFFCWIQKKKKLVYRCIITLYGKNIEKKILWKRFIQQHIVPEILKWTNN
jgi:hypothetical protein